MSENKHPATSAQYNSMLYKGGFAGVCLLSAMIFAVCLYKPFYTAAVSDVFNLSMDILGAVVCTMLYYGCLSSGSATGRKALLYVFVLFVNTLTILFDSLMWLFDGARELRVLTILVSTLFYASSFLLIYLFWRHACVVLNVSESPHRRMDTLQRIMLLLSLMLCLINFFTPILFTIDSDGVFHRAGLYPAGSFYILATFVMLIIETCRSGVETWRKGVIIIPAIATILDFVFLWNNTKFAISYTVSIIAMIITNCILYGNKVRMKELIIRVFATLLLCTMLVYGPVIYHFSSQKAISDGYSSVSEAFHLLNHIIDETGLDQLCDPDNTELYQATREKLRDICRAFDLQNLYVETIDQKEMTRSFIIVVASSDQEDEVVKETLGWPGASIWSEESFLTEPELIVMEGNYTDIYSEQDNEYGHNLDWFYPYFDAQGEVVAIFGADIDAGVQEAQSIRQSIKDIAPALVLFFTTLIVLLHMIESVFLKPFYTISRHIQGFFMEGNTKKEKLSFYSNYEVWFLAKSFDFMTSELDEYEKARALEIQEKQRISTELELAASIQTQFLPRTFPPYPQRAEFDIYASMAPAKEVAGDFYDFFFIDQNKFVMVIADVSGKGFPAALFMMRSKTAIRSIAEQGYSPATILEKVNLSLCEGNDKKMFVTVWLGIIDLTCGVMKCSNAGHEYPLIRKAKGSYEIFEDTHSPILGLKKKLSLKEYELTLNPGDSIFVYTDGIPEAVDSMGSQYGLDRLKKAVNEAPDTSMEETLSRVTKDVESFTADTDQFDDITMLGFRYLGSK